MKTVFVLLCVIVGLLASELPNDEKRRLKQVHDSCQANPHTYCDEDILRNLANNIDNPVAGTHMLCMSQKAGLQKSNGDLDIGVIKQKISLVVPNQARVDEVVRKCAVKQGSPERTANLLWLCFVQNNAPYIHRL